MPDVLMPQLGESVTEGTIGKWLKQVGETVAKYEPLVEVLTDKVNAEVPSDFEGVLSEIVVPEGETVKVGTVICRIASEGDGHPEGTTDAGRAAADSAAKAAAQASNGPASGPAPAPSAAPSPSAGSGAADGRPGARGRYSPAVLALAEQHGIDLSQVPGTGEGGRITRKDVLAYVQGQTAPSDAAPAAPTGPAAAPTAAAPTLQAPPEPSAPAAGLGGGNAAWSGTDDEVVVEPTAIRRTIARRMVESKHNAPHAWTMVEADVTKLQQFRDAIKADFKRREGIDLTYLPFFIKAVVDGLKQFPMLNASWQDDKIHIKKRIHISIAVATDDALVVPVIHDADRLSIAGLAHAANELAAKARGGRLTLDDVQGGTFTVNNTGAFGSILSQPIINAPQAAILSFESIVKRPVVVDDAIAIRSMVNLCLSIDHRLLDGWVAGQFLKAVKARLASFGPETVLY
ncbi:2-oxo acid dehydrogenase subunit E2 [Alicyclobacillus cycloheptanicus]|uniref:Dihydrolipoamide acetyltransferase component of pyruvate dehydrogenase complex n=1 Tax=Alicyclobacillus cycloheptanicus TaxID=1457 RepID=A0ABT9XF98_9BACL|nr:dihydrolipoamide acetyltransferase family protein [Alicyclobacillus cycloheptanicus]MDQ0188416.1 2-oxoisovalerate dehydrogenase E2 component (dihydrolipoyl transacylase) [Alicyclobacillus cycloheptanicus]WDM01119.1 2-oxo acid dehydrogenase subunit E2 [Alicyclobacillus cycloheptanicus]